MKTVERSIEVAVPVRTAYNQWTQFEEFPRFMEGVTSVRQIDDTNLEWEAEIAGRQRRWKARITEQIPDERIAWQGEGDVGNSGVVTFHYIDEDTTRVMLQMALVPESWVDKAADALGIVERRIQSDLERFKEFIEQRGGETGAWRGEVRKGTELSG